jgi:AP-3 complex subunit beta
MDQAVSSEILPLLKTLLKTVSPVTLGSTLEALVIIAGEDLALIHPHFRQICRLLIDTDEWGQVVVLEVLIRYARSFLKQPPLSSDLRGGGIAQSRNRNSEDIPNVNKPLELPSAEGRLNDDKELDPDLELLLSCTAPLLQSRNSAVSLAVVRLYHLCAPVNLQQSWPSAPPILSAMLRLCDSEKKEIACVAWDLAQQMAESVPVRNFRCVIIAGAEYLNPVLVSLFLNPTWNVSLSGVPILHTLSDVKSVY